ncbi:hypothetical protein SKAU_G00015630 [Synaphobranchus kaupii]|uniref:Transmembrane protein 252 n=1 Tax=Synaphobranchus kaupii TaxID=118154 RepID=A0A9Q1GC09_SYNKA|nr:hypothetical protein SKAU_G00015630 [Synaphobranchus kaupii]
MTGINRAAREKRRLTCDSAASKIRLSPARSAPANIDLLPARSAPAKTSLSRAISAPVSAELSSPRSAPVNVKSLACKIRACPRRTFACNSIPVSYMISPWQHRSLTCKSSLVLGARVDLEEQRRSPAAPNCPAACLPTGMMDLRKSVRKSLLTLAWATLPTFGFGFTCLGAFLLNGAGHPARVASAYTLIIFGFLLLTAGVSWAICLSVKSKAFLRQHRSRPQHRTSHIYTVDRPDFYPPSYEESPERDAIAVAESVWMTETEPHYNIAPPLYTASITEVPSEDYSSEAPPSYREAVLQEQSHLDTPGATLPGAPLSGH